MNDWLEETFCKQLRTQECVRNVLTVNDLPNVVDMYGSATGMIIEIGEMLQSDTRWKSKITGSVKRPFYNKEQFLEEMADVFIYFMNVMIYSGTNLNDFKNAVASKQNIVKERFNVQ